MARSYDNDPVGRQDFVAAADAYAHSMHDGPAGPAFGKGTNGLGVKSPPESELVELIHCEVCGHDCDADCPMEGDGGI